MSDLEVLAELLPQGLVVGAGTRAEMLADVHALRTQVRSPGWEGQLVGGATADTGGQPRVRGANASVQRQEGWGISECEGKL
jgi:hypothetical protein